MMKAVLLVVVFCAMYVASTPASLDNEDPYSMMMMKKQPMKMMKGGGGGGGGGNMMMMKKQPMKMGGKGKMGGGAGKAGKAGKAGGSTGSHGPQMATVAPSNGAGSMCISGSVANVRNKPCGSIVGTLNQGTQVTLVGSPQPASSCSVGNYQWQQISGAENGYVATSLLTTCASAPAPAPTSGHCPTYPLYKQCDSRWSAQKLGTSSNSICTAGCAMSSVAMAAAARGISISGSTVNPSNLDTWLTSHGGFVSGDLLVWGAVSSLGSLNVVGTYTSLSQTQLNNFLANCQPVVVNVRNGGHWVLVTSPAGGGNYNVNDPGFSVTQYAISGMSRFVVYNAAGTVRSSPTSSMATAHQDAAAILPVGARTSG